MTQILSKEPIDAIGEGIIELEDLERRIDLRGGE
jgi:hypothetical protein